MDVQAIIAAAVPVVAAIIEGVRRLKKASGEKKQRNERDNDTHKIVSNHLVHAVERIETKLDRVNNRLDRHIDNHS